VANSATISRTYAFAVHLARRTIQIQQQVFRAWTHPQSRCGGAPYHFNMVMMASFFFDKIRQNRNVRCLPAIPAQQSLQHQCYHTLGLRQSVQGLVIPENHCGTAQLQLAKLWLQKRREGLLVESLVDAMSQALSKSKLRAATRRCQHAR
jgi:hypothetical protein